jgi:hypothetical protein
VQQLRASGKTVDIVAKTHVACQNFGEGAVTADHWVRKNVQRGCLRCDVLVVEELTQMGAYLWNDISKACFVGELQAICLGDFHQMDAIADTWAGVPVPEGSLQRSDLLHELCGGVRSELFENKRSDAGLFNFYTGMWDNDVVLEQCILRARAEFPTTQGPADFSLTVSHAARMAINRSANQRQKAIHPQAVFFRCKVPPVRGANSPQSAWVWPGLLLVGSGGKFRKGLFGTVAKVSDELMEVSVGDASIRLTQEQFFKCARLASALCYAAVQGLTLPGRVRLCETSHPRFTKKHIYIGVSRATAADLCEVC